MEATAAERYTSGGPGAEPVVSSFPAAFQQTVARLGDGTAIVDGDRSLTWNELRTQARAVAGGLASLGVGKGDTVALMLNNRIEFFAIDLGGCRLVVEAGIDREQVLVAARTAVAVEDDHMLDVRQVLAGLLERLQEALLDDRQLGAGVADHVGDLLR